VDLKLPGIKLKSGNRNDGYWGIFVCYFVFACLAAVPSRAKPPTLAIKLQVLVSPVNLRALPLMSTQALNEVLEDQIIHGTHVFDKEPTLTGATVVASNSFVRAVAGGRAEFFYKIRKDVGLRLAIFRESEDMGTIAVRYVP